MVGWAGGQLVSAGDGHTCAVSTGHTVWCWGYNRYSQLGDGTTTASAGPVQEHSHTHDWAAVSVGAGHTCAVKANRTLWCWGNNYSGQLGNGTHADSAVPVQENTHARDWAAVSTGGMILRPPMDAEWIGDYTCAVKTSHTPWFWGYNGYGQFGTGNAGGSTTPVQEATHASDWATVSVGTLHTCAAKTTHSVWCWGYNPNGQVGPGAGSDTMLPVKVPGICIPDPRQCSPPMPGHPALH